MAQLRIGFDVAPAAKNIDALVAFVRQALGCADEPATRTVIVAPAELDRTTFTASSAELAHTAEWRLDSASCTVSVKHHESFFPGDVNEPPRGFAMITVSGARRGGPTVEVRSMPGDSEVWIQVEAPADECDRIFQRSRDTFATRKSSVQTVSS